MADLQFENQQAADKAFRANLSPRYLRLDGFEKWADGRQYEGLPDFWSDDCPLWERAPCIVYPVVSIAASSYVDLLLGQGRFPEFALKESEEGGEAAKTNDALVLDRFIRDLHKVCKFRAVSREMLLSAQCVSSACVVHGVRNGKPHADNIPAKWCTPQLGQEGEVIELEISYPYQEQFKAPNGKWAVRTKLYRRVITDERDVEYFPADAREDGIAPEWRENPERTVEHKLGFCPVVWYPFMRGTVPVNVIDGKPIHETVTDEIRQHDIARSQWHRGALYSEPQPYEIGVEPGFNPTQEGVTPLVVSTERGGPLGPGGNPTPATGPITGSFGDGSRKKARKKGPGYVYQYTNPDTKVGALTYPGDALKAQQDNCSDLRMKIQEVLAVVFLDPENIKFAATTSGKALEAIKQKQIDRCDQIRDDLTDGYFEPSVSMQLRIAERVLASGQQLKVAGADSVRGILTSFTQDGWQTPSLQVRWGDYFKPDAEDQQKIVNMVVAVLGAKQPVLTVKLALQKLAPIFGIDNIDAVVAELEADAKKRAEDAAQTQAPVTPPQQSAPVRLSA